MDTRESDRDQKDLLGALIQNAGPRAKPSTQLEARVRAAAYAEWQQTLRARKQRRITTLLAAAAVAAIAVTVGWKVLLPTSSTPVLATVAFSQGDVRFNQAALTSSTHSVELRDGDEIYTGKGNARIQLKSSASIRLAADTELRWHSPRELELTRGSLYIDSGPQHAQFSIYTPYGTVSHQGTRYLVNVGANTLQVNVREGRVDVRGTQGVTSADAGHTVKIDRSGAIEQGEFATFGSAWDWVDALAPRFDIENKSFAEFLRWAANESGRTLSYSDAATARAASQTTLHGSTNTLTPDEALAAIAPTTDFVVHIEGGQVSVSRR